MTKSKIEENISSAISAFIALLIYILLHFELAFLSLLISVALGILCIINLRIGLLAWFVVAPLSALISDQAPTIPALFNPAVVAGAGINLLIRRQRIRHSHGLVLLYLYIVISTLLVTGIHQYNRTFNIVIYFVSVIIISYLVSICFSHYKNIHKGILTSLLLSSAAALVIALESMGARRLGVEGSVRQLSNALAFSSLYIIMILTYYKDDFTRTSRAWCLIAVIPMIIGLIFTVSRGSILAFFLASCLFYLYHLYVNGGLKKIFVSFTYIIAFCTLALLITYDFFQRHFGVYVSVVQQRFAHGELEAGTGIRQYIWEEVLSSLSFWEIFFGIGLDGFRAKSSAIGIDYYSHSVFIDILATCGLLVLVILAVFMIKLIITSIKLKNGIIIGLIAFTTLNFLTHGSITAPLFWAGIALAQGVILKTRPNKKNVKMLEQT